MYCNSPTVTDVTRSYTMWNIAVFCWCICFLSTVTRYIRIYNLSYSSDPDDFCGLCTCMTTAHYRLLQGGDREQQDGMTVRPAAPRLLYLTLFLSLSPSLSWLCLSMFWLIFFPLWASGRSGGRTIARVRRKKATEAYPSCTKTKPRSTWVSQWCNNECCNHCCRTQSTLLSSPKEKSGIWRTCRASSYKSFPRK